MDNLQAINWDHLCKFLPNWVHLEAGGFEHGQSERSFWDYSQLQLEQL